MKFKSIFASLTFWAAILQFYQALAPQIRECLIANCATFSWWERLEAPILAFFLSIIARYNASALIYTPKGLPGRDKPKYSEKVDFSNQNNLTEKQTY